MDDAPLVTVADLKRDGLWKFTAHADGSDKHGRFSINFYECEIAGQKVRAFKKQWASGGVSVGYMVDGIDLTSLDQLAEYLSRQKWRAGDDSEARED
jgi:hypothetical protein